MITQLQTFINKDNLSTYVNFPDKDSYVEGIEDFTYIIKDLIFAYNVQSCLCAGTFELDILKLDFYIKIGFKKDKDTGNIQHRVKILSTEVVREDKTNDYVDGSEFIIKEIGTYNDMLKFVKKLNNQLQNKRDEFHCVILQMPNDTGFNDDDVQNESSHQKLQKIDVDYIPNSDKVYNLYDTIKIKIDENDSDYNNDLENAFNNGLKIHIVRLVINQGHDNLQEKQLIKFDFGYVPFTGSNETSYKPTIEFNYSFGSFVFSSSELSSNFVSNFNPPLLGQGLGGISPKPILLVERGGERTNQRSQLRRLDLGDSFQPILKTPVDSSERTRKLKLIANNKVYNDSSFGGDESNASQGARSKVRN